MVCWRVGFPATVAEPARFGAGKGRLRSFVIGNAGQGDQIPKAEFPKPLAGATRFFEKQRCIVRFGENRAMPCELQWLKGKGAEQMVPVRVTSRRVFNC